MSQTILIVEAEPKMRALILDYLIDEDYTVFQAKNGVRALEILKNTIVDLVLVDVMIELKDGYSMLRTLRKTFAMPVIILTDLSDEENQLKGYGLGVDDYIAKPFSPKVLMAKIKALLKRWNNQKSELSEPIKVGNLLVDKLRHRVTSTARELVLTPREYELLLYMIQNVGQALSREQIIMKVWGIDYGGGDRTVDIHITRLREKIQGSNINIETLWKVGYRMKVME